MKKKNRNIVLIQDLKELENEINFDDFKYKKYFNLLCNLIPNQKKERLEIEMIDKENFNKEGLVYIFVIGKKIFKIGHTITSITKRVQSYNCGKVEYRIAGTNSTTNYFILQSFLKINLKIEVFAYFPNAPKYEVFGEFFQDSMPVAKRAEKKIIKDFISEYAKKPIGCTQK